MSASPGTKLQAAVAMSAVLTVAGFFVGRASVDTSQSSAATATATTAVVSTSDATTETTEGLKPTTTVTTTARPTTTDDGHTGRRTPADCTANGQRFDDSDRDGWGYCVPVMSGGSIAPATTVNLLPPFTIADLTSALDQPARQWALQPSANTFDAVAAAAAGLLSTGRPMPAIGAWDSEGVRRAVETLSSFPGSHTLVYLAIDVLRPALPSVPFGDGTYTVGDTIQPGTYQSTGSVKNCYWETLDPAGEINDNNFISSAPQVRITVRASDFALHIDGCGQFIKIS